MEDVLDLAVLQGNMRSMIIRAMIDLKQELLSGNSGGPNGIAGLPAGSGRIRLQSGGMLMTVIKGLSGVPAGSGR